MERSDESEGHSEEGYLDWMSNSQGEQEEADFFEGESILEGESLNLQEGSQSDFSDFDLSAEADEDLLDFEKKAPQKKNRPPRSNIKGSAVESSPAHSDEPAKTDTLHRAHYVRALAALITHPKTQAPLTLGIYGPWGSGKSSFMIQLRDLLAPKLRCIELNPWRYGSSSELWYDLVCKIGKNLDEHTSNKKRIFSLLFYLKENNISVLFKKMKARTFASLKKVHNWITLALPAGVGFSSMMEEKKLEPVYIWVSVIIAGLWVAYKLYRIFKNPFLTQIQAYRDASGSGKEDFKKLSFSELDVVREFFKKTAKNEDESDVKIAIFLDDLDRCSPDRVVEVLEAVHLCLEGMPFVTVLGMDSRVVSHAVASRYKFMLEDEASPIEREAYGQYFLQKIVHIPFQLPPPWMYGKYVKHLMGATAQSPVSDPSEKTGAPKGEDADVRHLQATMDSAEEEMQTLNPLILSLKASPRSIKCLVNQYRLSKAINSQVSEDRQVNTQNLFYWLVLFQNWPKAGSLFFNRVAEESSILNQDDSFKGKRDLFPPTMIQFVEQHRENLRDVAQSDGGLELARCFSFLAPEGPFSSSATPASNVASENE